MDHARNDSKLLTGSGLSVLAFTWLPLFGRPTKIIEWNIFFFYKFRSTTLLIMM